MIYKSYLVEKGINEINDKFTLFYGENLGFKNDIKDQIKIKNSKAEIIKFNQEDILKNIDNFFIEISNTSLFENKKIYFIDKISDKFLDILIEIEAKIDNQKVYLFSDVLDRKSKIRNFFEKSKDYKVIPCYADNEIAIKQIIQEKLKNYKGLSSYNINLIISKSNLDRIKLNNELNKIIIYFQNKELNSEKLELLLDDKINNDFNLLKDEALMGNKINTNKLLSDTVLESEKNIFYLNLINLRLNKLNEISNLIKTTNLEDAISSIKPPIFWKDKANFTQQAKKWDTKKIRKILAKTYNVEIEIKSNSMIEKNILIKKLIIDMCNLANAS
jgi:DNA polymerase III subunit delta